MVNEAGEPVVVYEKKGKVAIIRLNRPEVLNAMNFELSEQALAAFQRSNEDPDINCVIYTGTGRAFQAGADTHSMEARDRGEPANWGANRAPSTSLKPVVAAVNGICAAGAFIMLAGCDVIICSDDATFFESHTDLGLLGNGEAFAAATLMPFHLAMRFTLMGRTERINADRAYQIGLVSEVVPRDKLMDQAIEIASAIASKAPLQTRLIRWSMRHVFLEEPYNHAKEEVARWVSPIVNNSPDAKEGARARNQRREPKWTGEIGPIQWQWMKLWQKKT